MWEREANEDGHDRESGNAILEVVLKQFEQWDLEIEGGSISEKTATTDACAAETDS